MKELMPVALALLGGGAFGWIIALTMQKIIQKRGIKGLLERLREAQK